MDCELCLEEFNQQEHLPKVLAQCGHTFCEKCILQLWESSIINCPLCRQKAKVNNAKDLPQTNFALLRVHTLMKEERKAKGLIEKYRVINPKGYLEIEETINRVSGNPNQLQLYGIYDDGELIYKEAIPERSEMRRIFGQRKYCFNKYSFLQNYFFMTEQTRFLIFFRKFTFCRHKFSCFENIMRTFYKTVGFYLMFRIGAKAAAGDKIFSVFSEFVKNWFMEAASDKQIQDMGILVEANAILGLNLYLLRKCFYSFPEKYLLPNASQQPAVFSRHSQYTQASFVRPDNDPTRGAAGDPYKPPVKYGEIMKQKQIEQPPPRFVRDAMLIDDIQGTRAKSIYRGVAKDIISAKDIEGTSPKLDKRLKPKNYDLMDVSDLNQKKRLYQSMRDPLNQVQFYQKPVATAQQIRNVEEARPKVTAQDVQEMLNNRIEPTWLTNQKYALLRPEPQKTLDVSMSTLSPDTMSAKSLYKSKIEVFPEKYDYYGQPLQGKDLMKTSDIQGTHAGSFLKTTKKDNQRNVNPLEPQYNYPGGRELQQQLEVFNKMKSQFNNRKDPNNQMFSSPQHGVNDSNVFQRSSMKSIHGDQYNEIARNQSFDRDTQGMVQNRHVNFNTADYSTVQPNNTRMVNYDDHPGKNQIFSRQMML
ncbi:UNKNOWN [Stylonychia lemnae]|uniref:RING-type domain-containing protein n=1 Tax=Stylonychia lemnae TaxID=5949 RepID=A0A078BC80_STYLE|nr:UNKNOWN [Stylonychia lemnae]|eukprot:CDW91203.1 UNKNOWN [Stylonychia lemnae]